MKRIKNINIPNIESITNVSARWSSATVITFSTPIESKSHIFSRNLAVYIDVHNSITYILRHEANTK